MVVFENLNRAFFAGVGQYQIPAIQAVTALPQGEFIPINRYYAEKQPQNKNIHFFVEDSQFIRHWNNPDRYLTGIGRFRALCAPDFSLYTEMPTAMQVYNHYRKHWLAAYWQLHGLTVYPTISWSTPESYAWCFDGEPCQSVVAVSSVGVMKNARTRELFLRGYAEMQARLHPTAILFYGKVPAECKGNIVPIEAFVEKFSVLHKRTC